VPLERETKQFAARVLRKPFSRDSLLQQLSAETKHGSSEER
jgi:hypothetical protein